MCCNIFAVLMILFYSTNADQSVQCGDWDVYKDEKCFKFIDNKVELNFDEANKICYQNEESSLVTIRSQEEQDFLYNLIHNIHKSVNDIWIGAQYKEKTIKWSENITTNYTNWANGYPINDSGYDCVIMTMVEPNHGKWLNEPCERNQEVVCQKKQNLLLNILKELNKIKTDFQQQKNELQYIKQTLESNKIRLENTEKELNDSISVFPTGIIAYFSKTIPSNGWLKANGENISRIIYANLFAIIGTTFGSGDGSTTFTLPDLRGEFIRGWSDGKDVDRDRNFGSFQWGSSIPMAGKIETGDYAYSSAYHDRWNFSSNTFDNGIETNVRSGQTRDGMTYSNDGIGNGVKYIKTGDYGLGYITTWNILKGTRPRNIALLACIKY